MIKKLPIILITLAACAISTNVRAAPPNPVPPTFMYQGSIYVDNAPFSGTCYFKLAIVDSTGATLWSNDGTSVAGSEPANSVTTTSTEGVFQIILGDTGISGMNAIDPAIFNTANTLYLHSWFNDGTHGFSEFTPAIQIASSIYAMNAQYLRGYTPEDFLGIATGGTLDDAYNYGGPGAGRTITVDSGAVQMNAGGANTGLEISTTGANTGLQIDASGAGTGLQVNTTGAGRSLEINASGTGTALAINASGANTALEVDTTAVGATGAPLMLVPNAAAPTTNLAEGQLFFDTTTHMLYYYDASRLKWLSVEVVDLEYGLAGAADDVLLQFGGDMQTGTSGARMPFDGTIVYITAMGGGGNNSKRYQVRINGAIAFTFDLAALIYTDTATNYDFNAGDRINVRIAPGGAAVNNPTCILFVKWRR